MVDFLKIVDFSEEIAQNPRLEPFLRKAANELSEKTKSSDEYKQPFFDQELNNIIVVVGLPETSGAVTEKLYKVLQKVLTDRSLPIPDKVNFGQLGEKTNGTAVFEFNDAENAKNVAKVLDGFPLDNKHTLFACNFMEFDQIISIEDRYSPSKVLSRKELQEWLVDPKFREQILIRNKDKLKIQWFDHIRKEIQPATQNDPNISSKLNCEWSKSGSYLVALSDKGFTLYGGSNFNEIGFFEHPAVKQVEFSPDEKYVLSFNGTVLEAPNSENYIVWNVNLKEKIRAFKAEQNETWGSFKWNFDGSYIAKIGKNLLSVYKLPAMALLEDPETKKGSSFAITNIQSCSWSPKKNFICAVSYTHEKPKDSKNEINGKVVILQIPERLDIKWKSIPWFMNSCEIHWDHTGSRLVLVLGRLKGKKTSTVIQIGDLSSKKELAVDEKEFHDVKKVNFDENVTRISVIHNPPQNITSGTVKYVVDMYKIESEGQKLFKELGVLNDKTLSHVLWSQNGGFFALVNTDKSSANLGFLEFGFFRPNNQLEIIKSTKIAYMNDARWDPSGRCLLTCSDTGHYAVWNGLGEQLLKDNATDLSQIEWRPRPKILLTEEKEAKIAGTFKIYSKKYEEEDDKIINFVKYEKERKRAEMKKEFIDFLNARRADWEDARKERINFLGFDEDNLTDVSYEEIIEDEIFIESKDVPK